MHDRMYQAQTQGQADWRVIKSLWPYLLAHKQRMLLALAFLVLAKVSSVIVPVFLKYVVDALDKSQPENQALQIVVVPLALLLAYGFFRFGSVFFNELRDAVFGRVAEQTLSRIGLSVFQHLHALDLEFHLSRRTGGLSRDIERGTNGISFLLRAVVFSVFPILMEVLFVTLILLFAFNWLFALIILVAVVLYVAFSVWVTEWRTEYVRIANKKDSAANTRAIDSLINFETVKYFNNEAYEADRYGASLKEREDAKVKNHLSLAALNSGQAVIIAGSITLIMLLSAQEVAAGNMSLGDLAMVNAYMIQVFVPLNILGFIYREIKRSLADVENMFGLLKEESAVKDSVTAIELPESEDGISFEHVGFAYKKERPILKDVSFTVKPGEKVAIVGPSGAGKSTLARLLFRFYEINSGSIKIGQSNIQSVTQASLRKAIGVVPQDTVLFNDTLLENIRYGNPNATQADVERAVQLAYLEPFINSLPEGYETQVGERGLKVSGGEKQRIAIARTILKNPRLLVFDEATSALDSVSEKAILEALKRVASQHTTLVIAHRLSTIVDADRILVLQNGTVAEQGSHNELLAKQGLYKELWDMQKQKES